METTEDTGATGFFPPLQCLRLHLAASIMDLHKITNFIDVGCGEGSLIDYMRTSVTLQRVAGIDISEATLSRATSRCEPRMADFICKRQSPLSIELYRGSICDSLMTAATFESQKFECATLLEVIEHMEVSDHEGLITSVFGILEPRVIIISTPNAEFNVLFTQKEEKGRETEDKEKKPFRRHWDHRFEWTREEFRRFCMRIVRSYPQYSVVYDGVGTAAQWLPKGTQITEEHEALGHCTQFAIFTTASTPITTTSTTPLSATASPGSVTFERVHTIEFPYEIDTRSLSQKVIDEARNAYATLLYTKKYQPYTGDVDDPYNMDITSLELLTSSRRLYELCKGDVRNFEEIVQSYHAIGWHFDAATRCVSYTSPSRQEEEEEHVDSSDSAEDAVAVTCN